MPVSAGERKHNSEVIGLFWWSKASEDSLECNGMGGPAAEHFYGLILHNTCILSLSCYV